MPIFKIPGIGQAGKLLLIQFARVIVMIVFFTGNAVVFFGQRLNHCRLSGIGSSNDKIGVFKACMLLFIMSVIGCGMFCLARNGSMTMATVAVLLVGAGMSVASVATSTYAVDIATEEDYPGVVSRFQTMQTVGGLAFAIMPGVLADRTGDYILAYVIMFAFVLISAIVIQGAYLMIGREAKNKTAA